MLLRKLKYLCEANTYQWISKKEAEKKQLLKLKRIITYAYSNSEFYRERFKQFKVKPDDLNSLSDIKKFPITSRELIKKNLSRILTKSNRCKHLKTSGSSGETMSVIYGDRSWDYTSAVYARTLFSMGYKPWHQIAFQWGPDPSFTESTTSFYSKMGIMPKFWVCSTDPPRKQLSILENIQPDVIIGFPSSLKLICRIIRNQNTEKRVAPKIIVSSFEVLIEETRNFI